MVVNCHGDAAGSIGEDNEMTQKAPFFEDVSRLMTGAMGAAQAAGDEARSAFRTGADKFVSEMDLATREEVEVLRDLARSAIERIEVLENRISELEAILNKDDAAK